MVNPKQYLLLCFYLAEDMQKQCWLLTKELTGNKGQSQFTKGRAQELPIVPSCSASVQHLFVFRINYFYQKQQRKE